MAATWKGRCGEPSFLMCKLMLLLALSLELPSLFGLSDDGQVLLQFKAAMVDTNGALKSWNGSDSLPCQWTGVTCNAVQQVTEIYLYNTNLSGPVPAVLCRLPKLTKLVLAWNYLFGPLPSGLFDCGSLEVLDLSYNLIVSSLPADFNKLQSLTLLDLSYNNFSGPVPAAFGDLPALQTLTLSANLLNGTFPAQLANLSNLVNLMMDENFLTGSLPSQLGNLSHIEVLSAPWCGLSGPIPATLATTNLTYLYLDGNSFSGPIPSELGNLKQLRLLDVSQNALTGSIPSEFMFLPELMDFLLWSNNFTGQIPAEVGNLSSLVQFDVSMNQLSGPIPEGLAQIPSLQVIQASRNSLTGVIPAGLGTLPNLYCLKFFGNLLTGPVPPSLGASSAFQNLDLSTNALTGPLPASLCAGGNLSDLILFENQLSGPIPAELGSCSTLQRVRLENNLLTGSVPNGLWASPNVEIMYLANNLLDGSIGAAIGGAVSLEAVYLDNNRFTGTLPKEIGSIPNLTDFSAAMNGLEGSLPEELGSLQWLSKLELGVNFLNGSIPVALGSCLRLDKLNLSNNHLTGGIPPQLGNLPTLNTLDLSSNELTGPVPPELGNLQLTEYNFSYNNLSGILPAPFNITYLPSTFEGNPELDLCSIDKTRCSPSSPGSVRTARSRRGSTAWAVGATFAAAVVIFVLGACCFWRRYNIQFYYWKNRRHDQDLTWSLKSFQKVNFIQEEVMDNLHENSLIGRGGSGKVYKAELSNGQVVAVKKLEARQDNGFSAEVETLGKIRHRNIVKLLCCCSNQKCNLLVYDYMPNGSLGDYLHCTKSACPLDWETRFKIAFGAAEGLAYLHHDCVPPIVHRDVKSNNILLDVDFEAHLGDFGLAKTFEAKSMSAVAGSYGYIAPEYAYTLKVTEKSDIYSFGVVLLELVSGKRPIESEFGDLDIVRWVSKKIETKAGAMEVLDGQIRGVAQEDMMLVLKVGLMCTSFLPSNRPSMRTVVQMLKEAAPRDRAPQMRSLPSKDCKIRVDPPLFPCAEKA